MTLPVLRISKINQKLLSGKLSIMRSKTRFIPCVKTTNTISFSSFSTGCAFRLFEINVSAPSLLDADGCKGSGVNCLTVDALLFDHNEKPAQFGHQMSACCKKYSSHMS